MARVFLGGRVGWEGNTSGGVSVVAFLAPLSSLQPLLVWSNIRQPVSERKVNISIMERMTIKARAARTQVQVATLTFPLIKQRMLIGKLSPFLTMEDLAREKTGSVFIVKER